MTITATQRSGSEESEHEVVQEGDVVMPFFILIDKSLSMKALKKALNQAIREFQQLILDHPEVADIVRIEILVFDSAAKVLVPLGTFETADLEDIEPDGGTNYSAVIRLLRTRIDECIASMKAQGMRTFRPLAFFLSDGEPNPSDTDWEGEFARQFHFDPETGAGNRQYPRVIPFGFGDAQMSTMAKLAYPPKDGVAFIQRDGTSVEDAFKAILPLVGRTILASGRTALTSGGDPSHDIATQLSGFDAVPSQYAGGNWM